MPIYVTYKSDKDPLQIPEGIKDPRVHSKGSVISKRGGIPKK